MPNVPADAIYVAETTTIPAGSYVWRNPERPGRPNITPAQAPTLAGHETVLRLEKEMAELKALLVQALARPMQAQSPEPSAVVEPPKEPLNQAPEAVPDPRKDEWRFTTKLPLEDQPAGRGSFAVLDLLARIVGNPENALTQEDIDTSLPDVLFAHNEAISRHTSISHRLYYMRTRDLIGMKVVRKGKRVYKLYYITLLGRNALAGCRRAKAVI